MATVVERNIDYMDGRARLQGRLFYDNAANEPRPLVLVLHAFCGPGEDEELHARLLAEAGYCAFVVDIYGNSRARHGQLWHLLRCSWYQQFQRLYRRRLVRAVEAVHDEPEVDASQLGAIGFCAGGVGVLHMLHSHPQLRAACAFHMGPSRMAPPERGSTRAITLVFHGGEDRIARLPYIKRLVGNWNEGGVVLKLKIFPDAGHAFMDRNQPRRGGMGYDKPAADEAWQAALAHFGKRLTVRKPRQAARAASPSGSEELRKHRFVISLFHGMGLQNRYMTLDELVQFLIRSLCLKPDDVLYGNNAVQSVKTQSHRSHRDRTVKLTLDRDMLRPQIARRLGEGEELEIWASEVYWAPITTGSAHAWKTILWLLGGLPSVVRAFVTMPMTRDIKKKLSLCDRQSFGQMESSADVWRLTWLLTRLAAVIIVVPLVGMLGGSVIVAWLTYWSVHIASRLQPVMALNEWWTANAINIHSVITDPQILSKSEALALANLLPLLGVFVPVLMYYIGSIIMLSSVSTPLSGLDPARTRRLQQFRPYASVLYGIFSGLALAALARILLQHWFSLSVGPDAIWQQDQATMLNWALVALLLPIGSLLWVMIDMGARTLSGKASVFRLAGYGSGLILILLALGGTGTGSALPAALALALILLGTWIALIRRGLLFIREYLGDVAAFVSTDENDKMFELRQQILRLSEEKLERVLGYDLMPNPLPDRYESCEEARRSAPQVIVMAHSLGTVVAYHALCLYFERLYELDLLELDNHRGESRTQHWQTEELHRRLKMFVTFGCPLDTVNMAFEATHSGKPVFDRILSHTRYRHGCPGPFKHCHWVNWWHRNDVVSAKVLWHAGKKGPVNRQLALSALPVVNHSAYLTSRTVEEDFRREFERLL